MKKKRAAVVFLVLCLLCSSCGGKEQTSGQTNGQPAEADGGTEKEWTLEGIELPDPALALESAFPSDEDRSVLHMGIAGETIYRYILQYDEQENEIVYFIQKLDAPYEEWETEAISLENETQNMSPHIKKLMTFMSDGELRFLYEDEGACYLEKISSQGYSLNAINEEGMAGLLEKADSWYIWNGENYIHASDGLYRCQEDFSGLKRIVGNSALLITQMVENMSGKELYLWGVSEGGSSGCLWRYDETKPTIEEEFFLAEYITFYSDTEGYLCDRRQISQFDVEADRVEEVGTYQGWGYSLEYVYGVSAGADGVLLVLAEKKTDEDDTEEYILLKRSEKEKSDKIELELATSIADSFLKESIAIFNRENDEYEIVLRERPSNAEAGEAALQEYEDYCARIQAEISVGNGPALIDTSILSVENGVAKGYLRDLTEDFAEFRGQCAESIWQNGMVDGKLYTVPYNFSLETILIPENLAGDKTSWTLEELMQLTRESGREVFGEYMKPVDVFLALGIRTESNSQLIDWENKVCYLDGPKAMELLEFSVEYGDDRYFWEAYIDAVAMDETLVSGERILKGEALTSGIQYLFTLTDVQSWETLFGMCDSVPVFIGFPSEDGEANHIMQVSDFAVSQSCEHPEGAVAFLQFLQSRERQDRIAEHMDELCSFPVRQESLDMIFEKALRGEYEFPSWTNEIMGEKVEVEPVSQETLQKYRQVIETAKPISRRAIELYSIVDEELAPYYAGEKSAQEVLDILQSRVQLYLNEMK